MTTAPTFDEIFAVMSTASLGDSDRTRSLARRSGDEDSATRFALALNVLLDDLAFRINEATAQNRRSSQTPRFKRKADVTFRGLLEAAPDAMVIVGRNGVITLVNAQTEALFGYSRSELLSQQVEILVPTRYRDNTRAIAADTSVTRGFARWGPVSSFMACARTAPSFRSRSA